MALRRSLAYVVTAMLVLLACPPAHPCTDLFITKGSYTISARTLDLDKVDSKVVINPRGISRRSSDLLPEDVPLQWIAAYGSVTVNAFDQDGGPEGMNEHGLSGANLVLAETKYPARDSRPAVNYGHWVQYFLDTCKTVAEAVNKAPEFRVVAVPIGGRTWPLHVVLHDASGDSAVLDYLEGQLKIHHSRDVNVLANGPPYKEQLQNLKRYEGFGGNEPLPGDTGSGSRFVRGAHFLRILPEAHTAGDAVAYAFSLIQTVAQSAGSGIPSLWTVVRDHTSKKYYFRSLKNPSVRYVDFNSVDFSSGLSQSAVDMDADVCGEVSRYFRPYTPKFQPSRLFPLLGQ
ncbi:MAG: linear amide C-N hydrolase [Desulfomonilaceae bacterium]|nr:linear amide C-N hydrolase [Desulfomonilaceae bacterium]